MILSIFLIVLALSLLLIVLGYLTDDEPYLPIGLFFLFLLSITIMNGNLELRDGSVSEKNLTYTNGTLVHESEGVTYTYEAWDDNTSRQVGIWMGIVTFLGFILSVIQFTRRSDITKNEY